MTEHTPEYAALLAVLNTGELYVDYGPGLEQGDAARNAGKELAYDYNNTRPSQAQERTEILGRLLGAVGTDVWIEPPLRVSYGSHVFIGDGFYANFNCVLVDDADVHIGDRVMFGPNVTLTTAGHPVAPAMRVGGRQYSLPITIGDDVWIGSNVVILPGVTVGAGSVIGAGSIVTRDVPEQVVALGNPCRVVRPIGPQDEEFTRRTTRPALPR